MSRVVDRVRCGGGVGVRVHGRRGGRDRVGGRGGLPGRGAGDHQLDLDGVFSSAQARRGRRVYNENCASCHGQGLRGGEMAPSVAGADFIVFWTEVPVGVLFDRIKLTMPEDGPGRLSDQEYTDVVAYSTRPERLSGGRERAVHGQGGDGQDHDRRRRVTAGGRAATPVVPAPDRARPVAAALAVDGQALDPVAASSTGLDDDGRGCPPSPCRPGGKAAICLALSRPAMRILCRLAYHEYATIGAGKAEYVRRKVDRPQHNTQ